MDWQEQEGKAARPKSRRDWAEFALQVVPHTRDVVGAIVVEISLLVLKSFIRTALHCCGGAADWMRWLREPLAPGKKGTEPLKPLPRE